MKKIFDFGKIDFDNRGKVNGATFEVELKDTPDGEEFTVCGSVWNSRHSDIVAGGQCLDEMAPFFKNNKLFNKLYKFWKLYHLNGMHPECEHQHAQKWHEIAGENVVFKIYKMTAETIDLQNKTQRNIKSRIIAGETVKATPKKQAPRKEPTKSQKIKSTKLAMLGTGREFQKTLSMSLSKAFQKTLSRVCDEPFKKPFLGLITT